MKHLWMLLIMSNNTYIKPEPSTIVLNYDKASPEPEDTYTVTYRTCKDEVVTAAITKDEYLRSIKGMNQDDIHVSRRIKPKETL